MIEVGLVVAVYNENIAWIDIAKKKYDLKTHIYCKDSTRDIPGAKKLPNVGREVCSQRVCHRRKAF